MSEIILPMDREDRAKALPSLFKFLENLGNGRWKVTVEKFRLTRSHQQNAYLWGVCYAELQKALPGLDRNDVHEYMLGEWGGWQSLDGFNGRISRPLRRSSKLSVTDFMDFVSFIQRKAAEHGVHIPDPDHGG